ncbi:MAG: AMP-binding protein, partial [bacterium]|nr:AMP-binding protein [bacterium]
HAAGPDCKRFYRTGDLARWLDDSNIEFLGRIDHQVKIRGFRIEPGEIASQLVKHEGVKEAVVLVHERDYHDKYLCAYIVADGNKEKIGTGELRDFLARTLPDFMIPAYFVPIEIMPLTSSGKIDKKRLPEPGLQVEKDAVQPRNEVERKLADIWAEVLGGNAGELGIDAHFFQSGGHSLK